MIQNRASMIRSAAVLLVALMAGHTSAQDASETWPPAPPPPPPAPTPAPAPAPAPAPTPPPPSEPPPPPPPPVVVDIELFLLMDVSASVDDEEFRLQLDGYIEAFRDEDLQELIEERNGVAVQFSQWSSTKQMSWTGWHVLKDEEDCEDFADRLERQSRRYRHNTIMARGINSALWNMQNNNYVSQKQIIDISGDGICDNYLYYEENPDYNSDYGTRFYDAVARATETTVINGISVGDAPGVKEFYQDILPHGRGAFAMHAETFEEFAEGIIRKLSKEISDPLGPPVCYD